MKISTRFSNFDNLFNKQFSYPNHSVNRKVNLKLSTTINSNMNMGTIIAKKE